jgi:hypothetical protein
MNVVAAVHTAATTPLSITQENQGVTVQDLINVEMTFTRIGEMLCFPKPFLSNGPMALRTATDLRSQIRM